MAFQKRWGRHAIKDLTKARILVIHPGLAPYRIDLFNRLCQMVHFHLHLLEKGVTYHSELDATNLLSQLKCPHTVSEGTYSFGNRRVPIGLGNIIRRFRPHIVVTSEFGEASWIVRTIRLWTGNNRFGIILWSADNAHIVSTKSRAQMLARRLLSRKADALLLYSEEIRAFYAERFNIPFARIRICANLQDEEKYRSRLIAAESETFQLRTTGCIDGRKVLLFVGRISPEKNLSALLRSLRHILLADAKLLLVLVGDGPSAPAIRDLALKLGLKKSVLFTGHLEGNQLLAWYRLAHLFILPSLWEPFGAVVNEALLAGVPVLCSSRAGASCLIDPGRTGGIFDVEDMETPVFTDMMRRWIYRDQGQGPRGSLMQIPFERDVRSFLEAASMAIGCD